MRVKAGRLVLFDVDGTLVSTGGRAGAALASALEETFGTAGPWESFRYSGKTDPQIVFELMGLAGLPRSAVEPRLPAVIAHYLGRLRDALSGDAVQVLPGVRELLAELAGTPGVHLGLLTGNVAPGAAIKLGAAGLDGAFAIGAYGSDDEDRNKLVAVARDRAREHWGDEFAGFRTVVIGDAEADVACARAGGARSVAVASGWTNRGQLASLGPDALLDTLEPPAALAAILG
ncbi:MAG: haloacid dehalogenase-like hydrolase [Acidobacteria bacterium]|nr:haloacid dehalogenase-like hydrolase [Acidobacteriota bacterium]